MKRVLSLLLILLLLLSGLCGCAEAPAESPAAPRTLSEMADKKIAVVTGNISSILMPQILPDAEYLVYNSTADSSMALASGTVDAFTTDESVYLAMCWEGMPFTRVEEPIATSDYGVIFPKGKDPALQQQFNTFLADFKASGDHARLEDKWFATGEPTEFLTYDHLTGENGSLRIGITGTTKPFSYIKNGLYTGFDVELLICFAEAYGYKLFFEDTLFSGVLTGVSTGTYDIGATGLTISDERRENVDFSDIYHSEDLVLVVLDQNPRVLTLEDFADKHLGVATGSYAAVFSPRLFPNAEILEYNTIPDAVLALIQGQIDGHPSDFSQYTVLKWDGMAIDYVPEPIEIGQYGVVFKKGENLRLRAEMDEFIAAFKANGEYDLMQDKWFGSSEPTEFMTWDHLTGENGTIKAAVTSEMKPFVYFKNGQLAGYDVEFLIRFAEEYGYKLEFTDLNFTALLSGVESGKYDLACAGLTITAERRESMDFSTPYHEESIVMIYVPEQQGDDDFIGSLRESFEKTFIREDRWKLIVQGVGTTMVISFFSVLLGTILGFVLYLLARSQNRLIRRIFTAFGKVYSVVVAGTPILVILMMLFYVILVGSGLSGVVVAILGFAFVFGSFVYDQLNLTVGSVDPGQTEAAYALGYSYDRTFFRIVLPQAMRLFIPSYSSEIVSLIKSTSIVGYIAVNDLTKMGDIIRGSTYEALFPLIAIALIYFVIIWAFIGLMNLLRRRINRKHRKSPVRQEVRQ